MTHAEYLSSRVFGLSEDFLRFSYKFLLVTGRKTNEIIETGISIRHTIANEIDLQS